jgi:hypothetical protein
MEFLLILAAVIAVVVFVGAPLRTARRGDAGSGDADSAERAELADLEAAKEAKYREIRDAELDYRTGKLSQQDYDALDGTLRAEAIELLRKIDAVRARSGTAASAVG